MVKKKVEEKGKEVSSLLERHQRARLDTYLGGRKVDLTSASEKKK